MTTKVLSNDFMQRSLDTEAWKYITMEFNWTYELIEKFKDKIDWHELCYSSRIFWSIPFINKYKEYIDWGSLSTHSPSYMITEEYLEEFKDNWNWSKLSYSEYLTGQILDQFIDKWNWENIINNRERIYDRGWNLWHSNTAIEFYERYKGYIPEEQLQSSELWKSMIRERKLQLISEIIA